MTSGCTASALRWQRTAMQLYWLEENSVLRSHLLKKNINKRGSAAGSIKGNYFTSSTTSALVVIYCSGKWMQSVPLTLTLLYPVTSFQDSNAFPAFMMHMNCSLN